MGDMQNRSAIGGQHGNAKWGVPFDTARRQVADTLDTNDYVIVARDTNGKPAVIASNDEEKATELLREAAPAFSGLLEPVE